MADDAAGAVRRTPRPGPSTEDRQTPETAAPACPGATNPATPVSQDAGNGSGELRAAAERLSVGFTQVPPSAATSPAFGCLLDTENDDQAYAELPECTACEGGGKDTHGTVFEAPLAVHFAGEPVTIAGRRRQLCMWCGHVLADVPAKDASPAWPTGEVLRVEDGVTTVVPYLPCDTLPPGCCALPDDDEPDEPRVVDVHLPPMPDEPCPTCDKHRDGCDFCTGTDTGDGSREELSSGDTLPDPGPDEAQETRAAADQPAEPVDTHADEVASG